ncbi:MAG: peptidoglycan recognition family protein [Planctomycetota bacterium]|nr:peptidoglycan recognition family protein [Planctomycetota bacterium]
MDQVSRRLLLRSGIGAGALALLAGCGGGGGARRSGVRVTPQARSDSDWEFVSHKPGWLGNESGGGASGSGALRGVVPRSSWTRSTPKVWDTKPMGRVSRITVHHDGMTPFLSTSSSAAVRRLEAIRNAHVSSNGWADIGYHFVVDPAGRVWEARPTTLQGAHVKYNNEGNLGVMVMGNYDEQVPTIAASGSLDDFVSVLMRRYGVPVGRVFTHREIRPTACPGRNLQRVMETARSRGGALARA